MALCLNLGEEVGMLTRVPETTAQFTDALCVNHHPLLDCALCVPKCVVSKLSLTNLLNQWQVYTYSEHLSVVLLVKGSVHFLVHIPAGFSEQCMHIVHEGCDSNGVFVWLLHQMYDFSGLMSCYL